MCVVNALVQDESVQFNPDKLTELYVRHGEKAAEDLVCRKIEELALQLTTLIETSPQGCDRGFSNALCKVAQLASDVGLTSVAHVAFDVELCFTLNDRTAFEATFARLQRVGQRSLTAIWDQRDLSM